MESEVVSESVKNSAFFRFSAFNFRKYSIDELEKSETSLRHSLEISLKNLQECGDQELYAHYSPILMVCKFHAKILLWLYGCFSFSIIQSVR